MATITELRIGNVRCFDGDQSLATRRIALLIGENCAGKSTALGCYNVLARIANLDDCIHERSCFDCKPFSMGKFDDIARSGSPEFVIGGSFSGHYHTRIETRFAPSMHSMPLERSVRLEFIENGNRQRTFDMKLRDDIEILRLEGPEFCFDLDHREISCVSILQWLSCQVRHGCFPYDGEFQQLKRKSDSIQADKNAREFGRLITFLRSQLPLPSQPVFLVEAASPLFAERDRTYAPIHNHLNTCSKDHLIYLAEMGKTLKLWTRVSILFNRQGNYDVLFDTPNGQQNLADVGYGIHSILSLLSSMYCQKQKTTFLLQHPEVHLHPSTQANLAQIMAESQHEFLIETHSDHIVDRFRICVMEGVLQPDEISIAYFDLSADGKRSQIHNLQVDKEGNLSNVPIGYRSFFMDETNRLLGFR